MKNISKIEYYIKLSVKIIKQRGVLSFLKRVAEVAYVSDFLKKTRSLPRMIAGNFYHNYKNSSGCNDKKKYFCPICNDDKEFENFGDPIRADVMCSGCGSLERHRFLFYIYKILFMDSDRDINLLHMAPEKCLNKILSHNKKINYIAADIDPDNYAFTRCLKEDFVNLSFGDKFFDVILSNQVLEHIIDEQKALSEMKRCLKDDGYLIINIPYNPNLGKTFEDANVKTDKERKLAYGQEDHVRIYGNDARKRFENAGFIVNQIHTEIYPKEFIERCRLDFVTVSPIIPGGYFILRKKS